MENRLSKRMQVIVDMVNRPFETAYDLCCDHGQIGHAIGQSGLVKNIVYVDQISTITEKIDHFIAENSDLNYKAKVLTKDARKLRPKKAQNGRLFIMAGIGGPLALEIVQNLLSQDLGPDDEIVLSGQSRIWQLRDGLHALNIKCLDEKLVSENGKYYEVIKLGTYGQEKVTKVGSFMWDDFEKTHREYISMQLDYLEKKLCYNISDYSYKAIHELYKKLLEVKSPK